MILQARIFKLAKDPEHPGEYQDACQVDAARGVAVIADGVSSAIFSAQWANLLVDAVVADAPDLDDVEAFAAWLQQQRQAWAGRIDTTSLAWFQRAKLPMGAFSTRLWIHVAEAAGDQPGAFGGFRLRGFAIGDSCLFHLRNGELVRSFPMQTAAEFQADPLVLGSVDLKRDHLMQFTRLDEFCYPDDLLVLCTDALGEWAMRQQEAGEPTDWYGYWNMPEADWQAEITARRHARHIRYDDTTLVLLRVVAETPAAAAPAVDVPAFDTAAAADPPSDLNIDDWSKKVRSVSDQVSEQVEQVSEQVLRGMKKLKEKALQKYREKFGPDKK
jgi:nucleotide-binding universal stress UspA family protein